MEWGDSRRIREKRRLGKTKTQKRVGGKGSSRVRVERGTRVGAGNHGRVRLSTEVRRSDGAPVLESSRLRTREDCGCGSTNPVAMER